MSEAAAMTSTAANAREIVIRRAEFKDADAIASIYWRARTEAMPWLAAVRSALVTRGWIARVLLKKEDVYVATLDGKVVGFVSCATTGREKRLGHMYVHPSYQRRGTGTMLFTHATRRMPDGFKVAVFARNAAALLFYGKVGCTLLRETDGKDNEEREPDVEFAWGKQVERFKPTKNADASVHA